MIQVRRQTQSHTSHILASGSVDSVCLLFGRLDDKIDQSAECNFDSSFRKNEWREEEMCVWFLRSH